MAERPVGERKSWNVVAYMHGRATTMFSEKVISNIIDDSRSVMSDVAFRTASPVGELSC